MSHLSLAVFKNFCASFPSNMFIKMCLNVDLFVFVYFKFIDLFDSLVVFHQIWGIVSIILNMFSLSLSPASHIKHMLVRLMVSHIFVALFTFYYSSFKFLFFRLHNVYWFISSLMTLFPPSLNILLIPSSKYFISFSVFLTLKFPYCYFIYKYIFLLTFCIWQGIITPSCNSLSMFSFKYSYCSCLKVYLSSISGSLIGCLFLAFFYCVWITILCLFPCLMFFVENLSF